MAFRVLALLVVAAVALYGLYLYHKRRGIELEQAHAKHHGWEKHTLSVRQEVWKCPRCRVPLLTWADVTSHRFGVESACAELKELQDKSAEQDQARAAAEAAQDAGRWSASAVASSDMSRDTAGTDSFTPAGELESGE